MVRVDVQLKTTKKGKKIPYYIATDEKGKIFSSIKVEKSGYTIFEARDKIKKTGTLEKDTFRDTYKMTNVIQYTNYKMSPVGKDGKFKFKVPRFPKKASKVFAHVSVLLETGQELNTSYEVSSNTAKGRRQAREKAMENIYKKIDQYYNDSYDIEDGKLLFDTEVKSVRNGWVYFDKR